MSSSFSASKAELVLVSQILARARSQLSCVVTGDAAVEIFGNAGLSPDILSTIWNLADEEKTGNLTSKGVAIAVRLIGWAQRGAEVTPDLINICTKLMMVFCPSADMLSLAGPLASIEGISNVDIQREDHSPRLPPLTQIDKDKFWKLFIGCGPIDGLLAGKFPS